jgi:hypothetical protein
LPWPRLIAMAETDCHGRDCPERSAVEGADWGLCCAAAQSEPTAPGRPPAHTHLPTRVRRGGHPRGPSPQAAGLRPPSTALPASLLTRATRRARVREKRLQIHRCPLAPARALTTGPGPSGPGPGLRGRLPWRQMVFLLQDTQACRRATAPAAQSDGEVRSRPENRRRFSGRGRLSGQRADRGPNRPPRTGGGRAHPPGPRDPGRLPRPPRTGVAMRPGAWRARLPLQPDSWPVLALPRLGRSAHTHSQSTWSQRRAAQGVRLASYTR